MTFFSREFSALTVGDAFVSRARTITEPDVVAFACLTGDHHPQHTDAVWSATSQFGGRIAHGMLVLSYALGLVPFDPERILALRGLKEAVFKRPVHLGDTIHVEGRIERLRQMTDGVGLAGCLWRVINQQAQLVARVHVEVLWRDGRGGAIDAAGSAAGLKAVR